MEKKKRILGIGFLSLFFLCILACNNGGGDDCQCQEPPGVATQVVQGDVEYCNERRLTGECVHTRDCDSKK